MNAMNSLLEFLRDLLNDADERAEYERNPEQYLREHGFADLCGDDVRDAMVLVRDNISTGSGPVSVTQHMPPPPPPAEALPGETDLDSAIRQLNYVTTNYAITEVDDRDIVTDNSVTTSILAGDDVNFDQDIYQDNDPVVASGDGAIAAGDDINGPVVTGDDNILGHGNVVAEDGSLAAGDDVDDVVLGAENRVAQDSEGVNFGSGEVTSAEFDHVTVDDGSALAVGDEAVGDNVDTDIDASIHDSFQDNHVDASIHDSGNTHVEESGNTRQTASGQEDNDLIDVL